METNPYLLVPLATWAIAQVGKFALAAFNGRIDFRYLYASGGMPSVHSAVVTSLAVTAFLVDGPSSHLFGLTVILAAIVMYDSFGVRRSSGEQAVAINLMLDGLNHSKIRLEHPTPHLREILGHKPQEVLAGAVIGAILGGLFNYDRLTALTSFIQVSPQRLEIYVYAGVFAALILLGIVLRIALVRVYRKSATVTSVAKKIFVMTQTMGWLGLALTLLVYERASYFAWRLWPLLVLLGAAVWVAWLATASYRTIPGRLAEEAEKARKSKWFNWGKNRSKSKR